MHGKFSGTKSAGDNGGRHFRGFPSTELVCLRDNQSWLYW